MTDPVTITQLDEWRREIWHVSVPSRPAWFVTCIDHPHLGRDQDGQLWGYATSGIARSVAGRHRKAYHDG